MAARLISLRAHDDINFDDIFLSVCLFSFHQRICGDTFVPVLVVAVVRGASFEHGTVPHFVAACARIPVI